MALFHRTHGFKVATLRRALCDHQVTGNGWTWPQIEDECNSSHPEVDRIRNFHILSTSGLIYIYIHN